MHGTLHCVNGTRRSRPISMPINRIGCNLLGLVAATELSSRPDAPQHRAGYAASNETASAALNHQELAQPKRAQLEFQTLQIRHNARRDIGIDHRGECALVFAGDRRQLTGERQPEMRRALCNDVTTAMLVVRVAVAVKKTDGSGLNTEAQQKVERLVNG
jgi:hypothetical protein